MKNFCFYVRDFITLEPSETFPCVVTLEFSSWNIPGSLISFWLTNQFCKVVACDKQAINLTRSMLSKLSTKAPSMFLSLKLPGLFSSTFSF